MPSPKNFFFTPPSLQRHHRQYIANKTPPQITNSLITSMAGRRKSTRVAKKRAAPEPETTATTSAQAANTTAAAESSPSTTATPSNESHLDPVTTAASTTSPSTPIALASSSVNNSGLDRQADGDTPEASGNRVNRRQVKWSPEMTTVMLRSLVLQIRAGKRSDNGFKAEVWNAVAQAVLSYDDSQRDILNGDRCQGKLDALKKKYDAWKRLQSLSGFGWDAERGVVTAPDSVWDAEILVRTSLIIPLRC
jgi:hypothetical protein